MLNGLNLKCDPALARALKLPRVLHVCMVVRNIESKMKYLSQYFHQKKWYRYIYSEDDWIEWNGKRTPALDYYFAISFSGWMHIEFIEPIGNQDNYYSHFLETNGEGVNHLGFFVSNVEERIAVAEKLGIKTVVYSEIKSRAGMHHKWAYLETKPYFGVNIEYTESKWLGKIAHNPYHPLMMNIGCMTGDVKRIRLD